MQGIDINKLAPGLFEDSNDPSGTSYNQKQGAILDWYQPDFTGGRKKPIAKANSNTRGGNPGGLYPTADGSAGNRKIEISKNKIQLTCHLNSIQMGELGVIGHYLKLEAAQEKNGRHPGQRKEKERERIKQPLFQFRYDGKSGKFIREIKDSASIDNATKDPNFVNGYFTTPGDSVNRGFEAEKISPMKGDDGNKTEPEESVNGGGVTAGPKGNSTQGSVAGPEKDEEKLPSADVSQQNASYHEDLFERRRRWGKGISVYRLVNGKFQPKELDEEIKKQQQLEDERKRKIEEEERTSQSADVFKNNIKSRKALQMAINDKSTPPAIRNLRMTMNVVVMALLALAITEYTIISS